MHELGITRNIVAIVSEQAGNRQVNRILLEIGKLSAIMPDAIRFCFDVCSKNTPLEHATLQIDEVPGRARCQDCGNEFEINQLFGRCHCGSSQIQCIAGEEMKIKEMEVI